MAMHHILIYWLYIIIEKEMANHSSILALENPTGREAYSSWSHKSQMWLSS